MFSLTIHFLHLAGFVLGLAVLHATSEPRGGLTLRQGALVLLASSVMFGFVFMMSDPKGLFEDFLEAYLEGGVAVRASPGALAATFEEGVHGFVNLPIVAYLFWPFAFAGRTVAALSFSVLGLLCAAGAWVTLVRGLALNRRSAALLLFAFAASGPLLYSVREGNISHFLLWPLAVAMFMLGRGQDFRAGLVLGAVALLKLPFLLFGVYYLLRGRWRVAWGGLVVCATAALLSVAVFGWDTHVRWYQHSIQPYGQDPMPAFNVQSIQAFVLRLQTGAQGLFVWDVTPLTGWARPLSSALVALAYASVFIWLWRTRATASASPRSGPSASDTEFMLVMALACVTSPLSWSHYFCWFLLPAAHFMKSLESPAPQDGALNRWAWCGLVASAIPVITIRWPSPVPAEIYARSGVSMLLFGGLAWMVWLACQRRAVAA